MKEDGHTALATAPLSKELIAASGLENVKHFRGHTDYLAEAWSVKKFSMMFYSRDINVLLATIHIPLSEVPSKLTEAKLVIAIENSVDYCKGMFGDKYRIGVCGLNPHAGEHGLLGTEEDVLIAPVVERYRAKGLPIDGPLPADTAFYKAYHEKKYNLLVAMYHDQGLAPFKLLHFIDGVNVTLGLPIVRTSPDHGTAFDIAGKGVADCRSMKTSLELAWEMAKNRASS
jgi:4-hydroxythreonine-4-phosphate dehydrogenase